jgi:hypothetical protein
MDSALVPRRAPSRWDERILAALRRAARQPDGTETRVGFRNERGSLYRRATLYGVAQIVSLVIQMDRIGFEDELLFEDRPRAGCDMIFTPSSRLGAGEPKFPA